MEILTPISFPEYIAGPRVDLEKHVESLAPEMFHLIDQNRKRLERFMSWAPGTKTVEDSRHWIRFTRESWKSKEIFDYGIYLKTGVYIGSVGLHTISWEHRCAEFGYWIGSESEGQGYVSEAVGLLEKVAFEMGFQRLEIRCDPNNLNSARLAERLGYQKEGQLRQNLLVSGLRRDTFVFGKLRS